jgi:hypothetical protein
MASDPLKETARVFLARKRAAAAAGKWCRKYRRQYSSAPDLPPAARVLGDGAGRYPGRGERGELYRDTFDGWRVVGDAHEVIRLGYTGWLCDAHGDNLAVGVVVQLPARDGRPRYFPAVRWTDQDGVTIYSADETDEKETAARWADHEAERYAERAREFEERERERESLEEKARAAVEEIGTIAGAQFETARELRAISAAAAWCFIPSPAGVVARLRHELARNRERVAELVETVREARAELERLPAE